LSGEETVPFYVSSVSKDHQYYNIPTDVGERDGGSSRADEPEARVTGPSMLRSG